MPLGLRPNREGCDRDLPDGDPRARICTLERAFRADRAERRFGGRCPTCGGDLVLRPTRPAVTLDRFPAQAERFVKAHPGCAA